MNEKIQKNGNFIINKTNNPPNNTIPINSNNAIPMLENIFSSFISEYNFFKNFIFTSSRRAAIVRTTPAIL